MKDSYQLLLKDTQQYLKQLKETQSFIVCDIDLDEAKVTDFIISLKEIKTTPAIQSPSKESALKPPKEQKPKDIPTGMQKKPAVTKDEFTDLKQKCQKLMPKLKLYEEVVDDLLAKKMKEQWKVEQKIAPVIILAGQNDSYSFLENIAKAISAHYQIAKVVKIQEGFTIKELLSSGIIKLICVSKQNLYQNKALKKHLVEHPQTKQCFIEEIPLLQLEDASYYVKDIGAKQQLWQQIQQFYNQSQ